MTAARYAMGVLLLLVSGEVRANGLEGLWLTERNDGHVRITTCGDRMCGKIVWLAEPFDETGAERRDASNPDADLRDRPVLGLDILEFSSIPDKRGVYQQCRVYDPKRGDLYRCKIRVEGDVLRMRGYLGISLLGKTTRWTRVDRSGPGQD